MTLNAEGWRSERLRQIDSEDLDLAYCGCVVFVRDYPKQMFGSLCGQQLLRFLPAGKGCRSKEAASKTRASARTPL